MSQNEKRVNMERDELRECPKDLRFEKHSLLVGLKTTVEGLLATNSHNVWNTFGGLDRVCNHVEKILCHRLKPRPFTYTARGDFWPFIQALKWISPVTAPTIEHFSRTAASNGDISSRGRAWLRDCLHTHCLSPFLELLAKDREHLLEHYHEDAFLCCPEYLEALLLCLRAIELNKVTLLTDINPSLLSSLQRRIKKQASHARSASLPINQASPLEGGSHLRWSLQSGASPPPSIPFASPGKESVLCSSVEHVLPFAAVAAASPEDPRFSAVESLRSVLRKSGSDASAEFEALGDQEGTLLQSYNSFDHTHSDPLLNMEFPASATGTDTPSSALSSSETVDSLAQAKAISRSLSMGCNTNCQYRGADASNNSSAGPLENDSPTLGQSFMSDDSGLSMEKPSVTLSPSKVAHKRSQSDGARSIVHNERYDSVSVVTSSSDHSGNQSDSTLVGSSGSSQKYRTMPARLTKKGGGGMLQPPAQGQSLLSYLSSQDFHTCANLDRENAHFSISEALIAAIEQMKWNRCIAPKKSSESEEESDEEINRLKQRIRIRRRERLKEKAKFPSCDEKPETASTSHRDFPRCSPLSFSSSSSSASHASDCESSDGVDDHEIELTLSEDADSAKTEGNLMSMKNSGLSLSLASLYSDAELQKAKLAMEKQNSMVESNGSAESVAISLLKKFSEKHLPKASELVWLVSEDDAPQALLPLPNSFPISPDDSSDLTVGGQFTVLTKARDTRIRGNLEWAPPRSQIIFNIPPYSKRSEAIQHQNYRCAGCGVKVEQGYIKRFRYCAYLGKYFCQCCHINATDYIPALILHNWDFSLQYVSNFSHDLLAKVHTQPHFSIEAVNPKLYRKVKSLGLIRDLRSQLRHLKLFFDLCRQGDSLLKMIEKLPSHWLEDSNVYSMADFLQVKNGAMLAKLKEVVKECLAHVEKCPYCQGFGFICEMCHSPEIIFPFQLTKVVQCPECRTCFHKNCFVPGKCPKCFRIEARRQRLAQESTESDDSDGKISEQEEVPVNSSTETTTLTLTSSE